MTKVSATIITAKKEKLVQKASLHDCLNKLSKAVFSNPVAKSKAIITAPTIRIPTITLNGVLAGSFASSPETNPQSKRATKRTTMLTVKNNIKCPTTSFGETAPTKIKPITNAMNALSCLFESPKTFVFSKIPKTIRKIKRKGNMKFAIIQCCKIVSVGMFV